MWEAVLRGSYRRSQGFIDLLQVFAQITGIFQMTTIAIKAPIGTLIVNYRLESTVKDKWLSC